MMSYLPFLMFAALAGLSVGTQVVEVYIVTEPEMIRNYMRLQDKPNKRAAINTMKADIAYYMNEVNIYYKTLKEFGLDIEIRTKSIHVISRFELISSCRRVRGKEIQVDFTLDWFTDFMKTDRVVKRHSFDVGLLFTGFDLYKTSGDTSNAGYANLGTVCNKDTKFGVLEYDMTTKTVVTIAHEMGHILGATHSRDHKDCPVEDGYIMAPTVSPHNSKRWSFSNCTANDIKQTLEKLDNTSSNCLKETTSQRSAFKPHVLKDQSMFDPETICKRKLKTKDAYFCSFRQFYAYGQAKGDLLCQYLYCGNQGSGNCQPTMPPDGMFCDEGKRCNQGKCVAAPKDFPTPPVKDPECFHGDIKYNNINGENMTCSQFVDTYKGILCEQERFRGECCESCKKIKTDMPECPYGDRSTACGDQDPRFMCLNPNNAQVCCKTCSDYAKNKRPLLKSKLPPTGNNGNSNGGQSNNGQSNNGQSDNGQSSTPLVKITMPKIKMTRLTPAIVKKPKKGMESNEIRHSYDYKKEEAMFFDPVALPEPVNNL